MKSLVKSVSRFVMIFGMVFLGFILVNEWKRNQGKYKKEIGRASKKLKEKVEEGQDYLQEHRTIAIEKVKEVVEKALPGEQFPERLTARQKVVYAIIRGKKKIEMKDLLPRVPGVTERTLRRDLLKLQEAGLIEKQGSTKSSIYLLKS